MDNKQATQREGAIKQSNDMAIALKIYFTNYLSRCSDNIMNDGVVILGVAKFAGFFIGKLSGIYQHSHLNPINEFEELFREYAEKSEQMFLKKRERATEGEE